MIVDFKMNREIIRLASPVIVGMISHTVLNIVDTAMVGRLGNVALGAVGLGSFFILIMVLVFGSLNIGTQAITARRLGEKRTDEFRHIYRNSLSLAFVIGIFFSVIGYLLSPWIFSLLSGREEIVREGTPYLGIRFLGLFSMVVIFTLRGFVYGMARPGVDMAVSIAVNMTNIILNYFLIFGIWIFPRLEVRGAAIASVISTVLGLFIYIGFINIRIIRHLPLNTHGRKLSANLMSRILRISAPRAVQSMSIIGFIVLLGIIGKIGVDELAISNIIFKVFNLSFMTGIAIGAASATLVGRSLGERREKLAARYGWHSVGLGALSMGIIGTLFIFFPREIMGFFTKSPETIEKGVAPFRVLGAFQCLDGVGIVLSRTLQVTGNTFYVMVSEMIAVWCIMVPFAYWAVVVRRGGLLLTWCGLFMYIIFFSAAMMWKFHEGGWKHVRI